MHCALVRIEVTDFFALWKVKKQEREQERSMNQLLEEAETACLQSESA